MVHRCGHAVKTKRPGDVSQAGRGALLVLVPVDEFQNLLLTWCELWHTVQMNGMPQPGNVKRATYDPGATL